MPSSACIDENRIASFFERRLSASDVRAIDDHVAECADCRELLAAHAELYPARTFDPSDTEPAPFAPSGTPLRGLMARLACERRVGTMLQDKWRLDAVLGVGGMAEVYAATHRNGKRVAIKMLRAEFVTRPLVVSRFLREGYVANRVGHPGAVSILDDSTTETGTPFLVMELLDGRTLATCRVV